MRNRISIVVLASAFLPVSLIAQEHNAKRFTVADAKKIIAEQMADPEAVRFRNVRQGRSGFVCGEFNAKNAFGAYTGYRRFYVTGPSDDGLWEGEKATTRSEDAKSAHR
jgi:hypothetical protein